MADTNYSASDYFDVPNSVATQKPAGVPEGQDFQASIEQDLNRSLTPEESSDLARQVKSGKVNFHAAPDGNGRGAGGSQVSADDYFGAPSASVAPQASADDYFGPSTPAPATIPTGTVGAVNPDTPMTPNTKNWDYGGTGAFIATQIKGLGNAVSDAYNAIHNKQPNQEVKLTPTEQDVYADSRISQIRAGQHYDPLAATTSPVPAKGTPAYDAFKQDLIQRGIIPSTKTVSSEQDLQKIQDTQSKPQPIGVQDTLENNMFSNLAKSVWNIPMQQRQTLDQIQDYIKAQSVVRNAGQYDPKSVDSANKLLNHYQKDKPAGIPQMWNSFIQSALEDPGTFVHGLAQGLLRDPWMAKIPEFDGLKPFQAMNTVERLAPIAKKLDKTLSGASLGAAINVALTDSQNAANLKDSTMQELGFSAMQGAGLGGLFAALHKAKPTINALSESGLGNEDLLRLRAAHDIIAERTLANPDSVDLSAKSRINQMLGISDNMTDTERLQAINKRREDSASAFTDPVQQQAYLKVLADERMKQAAESTQAHFVYNNDLKDWVFKGYQPKPDVTDVTPNAPKAQGSAVEGAPDISSQTAGRTGGAGPSGQGGAIDRDLMIKLGVGAGAFTAGAAMFPQDKVKGGLAAVMLAGLGAVAHDRGIGSADRLAPSDQMGAVKLPGGEWNRTASNDLANDNLGSPGRVQPTELDTARSQKMRMVQQYIQKYAGTDKDPLKNTILPTGERWEDLMDKAITQNPARSYRNADREAYDYEGMQLGLDPKIPDTTPIYGFIDAFGRTRAGAGRGLDTIADYLQHVQDYLRTVPESKLPQYDLPRAVRETQAWDAENARKMAKARAKSMEGMPVYKDYGDEMKWVQLTKPEDFPQESDMMGHSAAGYSPTKWLNEDGTPRTTSPGTTDEQALKFGFKKNPDWREVNADRGHPSYGVGTGGWEAIKNGSAKVYSLRDAQGNSHVTVEVESGQGHVVEFWHNASKEFKDRYPAPTPSKPNPDWVHQVESSPEYQATSDRTNITQIKGKQNAKPADKYLPYVQDFVQSGKWGYVGDLGNADLVDRTAQGQNPVWDKYADQLHPGERYLSAKQINEIREARDKGEYGPQSGKIDPDLLKKLGVASALGLAGAAAGSYLSDKDHKGTGALTGASLPLALLLAHHLGVGSGDSRSLPQDQIGAWKPRLRFNEDSGKWHIPDIGVSQKASSVETQRAARGQEPLLKINTPSVTENLKNAKSAIDANPSLPHDIVARILGGDNSIRPEETSVLQVHGKMLDDQLREQNKIIGDPNATVAQRTLAKENYDSIVEDAHKLDLASQVTRRSWHDNGMAMQAVLHDFTMLNVLSDARRMKEEVTKTPGVALTPEEVSRLQTHVSNLENARDALQSHMEAGRDGVATEVLKQHIIQAARENAPTNKPHFLIRMKAMADKAREDLNKSNGVPSNRGQSGAVDIESMWNYLKIGMYHIANGAYEFGVWNAKMKADLGDKFPFVRKASEDLFNLAKGLRENFRDEVNKPIKRTPDEVMQAKLGKKLNDLKDQLRTGNFPEPITRVQKQWNAQTQELQKAVGRAKYTVAAAKNEVAFQNASLPARIWRRALQTRMFGILSILDIIPKLGASSLARVVLTPAELALEQLGKQLPGFRQLAGKGDYSNATFKTYIKSEIAAIKGAFGPKAGADILSKLKGNPQLTAMMVQLLDAHPEFADSKSPSFIPGLVGLKRSLMDAHIPDNWDHVLDMPGRVHDILKTPAERGEFERAQVRFTESERAKVIKSGMTPEHAAAHIADPRVQAMIQLKSFTKSLEAKFQQDARAHELIKGLIALIGNEKFGVPGKLAQGLANFELPIVKTPINLMREGTHYAPILGLVKAGIRGWAARGEKFTPADADYILKMIRKQPVGVAAAIVATVFYQSFGHNYHEGNKKKGPNDIPYGAARTTLDLPIIGHNIPAALMHFPLMQMMTTVADMTNAYVNTKHGKSAGMNAATTLLSDEAIQLPGAFQLQDTAKSIGNPSSIPAILGRQAASLVPGVVSGPTEYFDAQKRYPTGFLQQIEAKVPGLRQNVPTRPHGNQENQ